MLCQGDRLHNWAKDRDARLAAKRKALEDYEMAAIQAKSVTIRSQADFNLRQFVPLHFFISVAIVSFSHIIITLLLRIDWDDVMAHTVCLQIIRNLETMHY